LVSQLCRTLQRPSNIPQTTSGLASCSRRRYASVPDHPAYKDAEESSKPLAVKERRKPRHHHTMKDLDLPPLKNNPTIGLQPDEMPSSQRYRLRGIKDGKVVGTRIYLPNMIMRMVRNGVTPGEPYNPYKATFHVPTSVTKNDIKSYLLAVYGVETTYINTEIPHQKGQRRGEPLNRFKPNPHFKRAIVGLVEPFYYPDDPADMTAEERKEYAQDMTDRGKEEYQAYSKAVKVKRRLPSSPSKRAVPRSTLRGKRINPVDQARRDSVDSDVIARVVNSEQP